jgi:hypothetical protein
MANAYSWEKLNNIHMTLAFRYLREKVLEVHTHIQDLSTNVASQIIHSLLADGWTRADLAQMNTQVFQLVKPYMDVNRLQESAVEAEHSEESAVEAEHSEKPKSQEEADVERAYEYLLELRQAGISKPRKRRTDDRDSEVTTEDLRGAQVNKRQRTGIGGKLFKLFTLVFNQAL